MSDTASRAWVLDLDGVLWRGREVIPGSVEAVLRLLDAGVDVTFCTNNSSATMGSNEDALSELGLPARGRVVTSATAVAAMVRSHERVLVAGGAGIREALATVGASLVRPGAAPAGAVDTVVVGYHRDFDYDSLSGAARAIRAGARLLATNDDPVYPAHDGPLPGCGALVAYLEVAGGRQAVVAGKPYEPMGRILAERHGVAVFVGDSLGTDRAMAQRLGWPFGLVLSGNTEPAAVPPDLDPAWVAVDLATLVDAHLGH